MSVQVDTAHEDMIHDAQLDYYSRMLATASSDKRVHIFQVTESGYTPCAKLTGHEGPVWQVAWAHPKFGSVLASCSYDGSVLLHQENGGKWTTLHQHRFHESSVNSIDFAPHEHGLMLACAGADGKVSVLQHMADNSWQHTSFTDAQLGVNSVSWAPPGDQLRLVTGGCDNKVRVWARTEQGWEEEAMPETPHTDWVRDVAWAPSTGLAHSLVASASEDRSVYIWTKKAQEGWTFEVLHVFDAPVWRVSWSVTGNVLAVSSGDSNVTLWKQQVDGAWAQVPNANAAGES